MAAVRKLKDLEARLGHAFKDRTLFKKALTHASVRQASARSKGSRTVSVSQSSDTPRSRIALMTAGPTPSSSRNSFPMPTIIDGRLITAGRW